MKLNNRHKNIALLYRQMCYNKTTNKTTKYGIVMIKKQIEFPKSDIQRRMIVWFYSKRENRLLNMEKN